MKRKGGALPLRFFDPSAPYFAGNEGNDVLGVSGNQVRPAIGGRQRRTRRSKCTKGFTSKRKAIMKGGFTSKRRAAAFKGGFTSKRRAAAFKGGFTSKRRAAAFKGGFTSKRRAAAFKGGFIPSIMEPFVAVCSKYVAPVAFLSAYKFMNRKSKKSKK